MIWNYQWHASFSFILHLLIDYETQESHLKSKARPCVTWMYSCMLHLMFADHSPIGLSTSLLVAAHTYQYNYLNFYLLELAMKAWKMNHLYTPLATYWISILCYLMGWTHQPPDGGRHYKIHDQTSCISYQSSSIVPSLQDVSWHTPSSITHFSWSLCNSIFICLDIRNHISLNFRGKCLKIFCETFDQLTIHLPLSITHWTIL